MIRARFYATGGDPRPAIWPPPGPFWCSGYALTEDAETPIVIAYADNVEQIKKFWPDAEKIDASDAAEIVFTDRFPRPDWWKD